MERQNALEVLGRARPDNVHNPTATSKALWQYFGVPSTLGSGLLARAKLRARAKPRVPRYAIFLTPKLYHYVLFLHLFFSR